MHHRSQFTASRFVNHHADEERETSFSVGHSDEVTPTYPPRSVERYTETDSSEISDMLFRDSHSPRSAGQDAPRSGNHSFETVSSYDTEFDIPGSIPRSGIESPEGTPSHSRRGAHRLPTPPSALKGRAAVLAVAAGAVVAAGQAAVTGSSSDSSDHSEVALASDESSVIGTTAEPQAAQFSTVADTVGSESNAPQVLNVANPTDLSQFSNLLAKGQRFSEERAAREAAARRPLFVLPTIGTFTSNFGSRWGTLHAGVDIAAPIGTPIVAVADGEVIDSGPASGFGMWVRLKHADGTVTVYGHINTSTVTVGQKVMAGDQIATVGNRGFSTGPHLHFEVHLGGENKVDPLPWLASRGISLGPEMD
ncbi:M23 family metallopeptidase [Rhodococcus tibetensis]|uniref:M23 family metallopeptidase n=1 Tax=Rhodococcus tibetensis TaxID=2965064 RepID=A0ABT1Q903_9NOCA|nr:M23 family metallopeptidase [Rhodococcus sp. FXJ9.536]MCQ4118183.1 M23 family metallopeptidase [Rhodococcus sp. FXJ9.536]